MVYQKPSAYTYLEEQRKAKEKCKFYDLSASFLSLIVYDLSLVSNLGLIPIDNHIYRLSILWNKNQTD